MYNDTGLPYDSSNVLHSLLKHLPFPCMLPYNLWNLTPWSDGACRPYHRTLLGFDGSGRAQIQRCGKVTFEKGIQKAIICSIRSNSNSKMFSC